MVDGARVVSARWRVVRLSSPGSPVGSDMCRHRFQLVAYLCARRWERATPIGVWFDVQPVVKP